jgi:hypothetical protein
MLKRLPIFLRILKVTAIKKENRSRSATGSQKHRDPLNLPYAFTEHGTLMHEYLPRDCSNL